MLTKSQVIKIAELFFNGKPEESYKLVSSMSEWDQFINSVQKDDNQLKAYEIMAKSDIRIWEEHTPFISDEALPTYEIGY